MLFAAVHESLVGTLETPRDVRSSVAIRGKADVTRTFHFGSDGPLAEVSRQLALPRGDAEVAFQRKILNQGLFFRILDISFGLAKPRD
jgi:hypothetical protein